MPAAEVLNACREIAAPQFAVISAAQALGTGLSRHSIQRLVRSGAWIRMRPSTYAMWIPSDSGARWRQRLMASWLWIGESAAVSHRAAMLVWGLDGMVTSPLELTTTSNRRSCEPGLILHRAHTLEPADVTKRGVMRITSVPRTLADLCTVSRPSVVEKALESAFRLGLTTVDEIQAFLSRGARRRPKASVLETLIDRTSGPAMESVLETEVWALLRDGGLPAPERQYEVRDVAGHFVARVDFAYPGELIALEADGHAFHSSRRDWQRDRERQNALVRLGWKVYRITWEDVRRRRPQVVADINGLLRRPTQRRIPAENVR